MQNIDQKIITLANNSFSLDEERKNKIKTRLKIPDNEGKKELLKILQSDPINFENMIENLAPQDLDKFGEILDNANIEIRNTTKKINLTKEKQAQASEKEKIQELEKQLEEEA